MNVNYHKWLDCEITHNYFTDGICPIFSLTPMQGTTKMLRNFNILLNKQLNIHTLYSGLNNGAIFDIATQFNGITNLYFQITVDDAAFFSYTNLNSNIVDPLLYFSNTGNQINPQQLHSSSVVTNDEFVNNRPNKFTITLPSGETKLEIKSIAGTTVIEQQLSNPNELNYLLDLSQQEDDAYELWVNDELREKFFKSSEELISNTIGIIHLNMEAIIANYADGLKYKIDFVTRSVFWRYKIVVPESRKIEVAQMGIKGMDTEAYEGPVEEALMGNQMAQIFTSNVPMPLKQQLKKYPQLSMSYTSEFSNRTTELEIKLPNPGIENITKNNNEEGEDSFFSSTIIYV